jgi:hypothetical protein
MCVSSPAIATSPPTARLAPEARPVVAILGLFRGGTSVVAGVLHRLGLEMGPLLPGGEHNPTGFYEDVFLRARLRQMWGEPDFVRRPGSAHQVYALRVWRRSLIAQLPSAPGMVPQMLAVKHPLLCLMGPQMIRSWGPATRFISVVRPMDDCLASLSRVGWWPPHVCQAIQQRIWTAREAFLSRRQHLQLSYDELLSNSEAQIGRIVQYLSLDVGKAAFAAAHDFIRKPTRLP